MTDFWAKKMVTSLVFMLPIMPVCLENKVTRHLAPELDYNITGREISMDNFVSNINRITTRKLVHNALGSTLSCCLKS